MNLSEWEFQEEEVLVGRGRQCNLMLEDSTKVVSNCHALIKQENNQYYLIDKGSMNGTLLDGKRLEPEQSCLLASGSLIGIAQKGADCAYTLRFEVHGPRKPDPVSGDDQPTVALKPQLPSLDEIVDQIREEYWKWETLTAETRQEKLCHWIREIIKNLDDDKSEEVLNFIEMSFPHFDGPNVETLAPKKELNVEGEMRAFGSKRDVSVLKKTRKFLESLVGCPLSVLDRQQVEDLDERLAQSYKLFLEFIMTAVNARREFEQEMGWQVTAIFSKEHNSMKWMMSPEELGASVFEIDKGEKTATQTLALLKELLDDVTQHQQSVVEGLRECVKGVLMELKPEKIMELVDDRTVVHALAVWPWMHHRFWGATCWKVYQEHYESLLKEERDLEKVIRHYFEKGYLGAYSQSSRES